MHNLTFVPYKPQFLERMFTWRNQPSTLNFNPVDPITMAEFGRRCEAVCSDLSVYGQYDRYRWCLELDGRLVGHLGFTPNYKLKTAEIGYAIDKELHGRGIATEAVRLLVQKLFSETDVRRLTAGVHEKNIGSQRVLEKVGFKREGVLREHFFIRDIPADEIAFGLLRREWEIVQERVREKSWEVRSTRSRFERVSIYSAAQPRPEIVN